MSERAAVLDLKLVEARTVSVTVLVIVGLYLILALEATGGVRGAAVSTLCAALLAAYLLVLLVPFAREFFSLALGRRATGTAVPHP